MFTSTDKQLISSKGISEEVILSQLEVFRHGFPFLTIERPALINDGIFQFSDSQINELISYYDAHAPKLKILKFVPASGAATRMFKDLFTFVENHLKGVSETEIEEQKWNQNSVIYLIHNIEKLACYDDLKAKMAENGFDISDCIKKREYSLVIDFLLSSSGLDYASLPKGLLKFHKYSHQNRTSIEEHLVEGAHYARKPDSSVEVHFTISKEHKEKVIAHISKVMPQYEKLFDVSFNITYSEQKPSTDTIAVYMNNQPYRDTEGNLLFRPAGHGALIENLNDMKSDIVFVKNIDNVVPDRLKDETFKFKKVIGGLLLKLQNRVHNYLKYLEIGELDNDKLIEIEMFSKNELMISFENGFSESSNDIKAKTLFQLLNRPIRVCGMVKNVGEPGGGPFWVKDQNGKTSLQIVESSQVNVNDVNQKKIFETATHFNPVDLVCALNNYKNQKFNLPDFVDENTGFISVKSKDGVDIKAMELPGLWNGAMANWITIFVEVPLITFNPVKTINDLLRPEHQ